jgi:hypothetical protein
MDGSAMSSAGEVMPAVPPRSPSWRKSSHSNPSGECVELSRLTDSHINIRHSRHPDGFTLVLSYGVMVAFVQRVKNGDFDEISR